ncbi:MAG: holo-ACP synthase [Myxococcales bacterium]|nr:holo-ACP synthase [Myxococcales bacterium]
MVRGVGIDLVTVSRIARTIERFGARFTEKIFTPGERAYCETYDHPAQHYAARFAAKEAILKALGVPKGLSWHELEVVRTHEQRLPRIALSGEAARAAAALGVTALHLSLSHEGDTAAAFVVADGPQQLPTDEEG